MPFSFTKGLGYPSEFSNSYGREDWKTEVVVITQPVLAANVKQTISEGVKNKVDESRILCKNLRKLKQFFSVDICQNIMYNVNIIEVEKNIIIVVSSERKIR